MKGPALLEYSQHFVVRLTWVSWAPLIQIPAVRNFLFHLERSTTLQLILLLWWLTPSLTLARRSIPICLLLAIIGLTSKANYFQECMDVLDKDFCLTESCRIFSNVNPPCAPLTKLWQSQKLFKSNHSYQNSNAAEWKLAKEALHVSKPSSASN